MKSKFTEEEISKRLKNARPLSREQFFRQLKEDLRTPASQPSRSRTADPKQASDNEG